jgi:hypothetical protein
LNFKIKTAITAITLSILIGSSALLALAPSVNAAFGPIKTFSYIGAYPTPIGVGQNALVTYRVDQPAAGALSHSGHFNGTSVTITKPDGTTETKTDLAMDATSSGWFTYTPTQTGTYTFQMHFPIQEYDAGGFPSGFQPIAGEVIYAASESALVELVVQEEAVENYNRSPALPTEPWSRPIYSENKGWWQISDSWLMTGNDQNGRSFAGSPTFAPYTSGPHSPHILWTKQIIPGGIVGGQFSDTSFYTGISYEQHFNPIILDGTVMYTPHSLTSGNPSYGTTFFDLYTGEDKPQMDVDWTIAWAQLLNIDNPNEHGVLPYIWDTSGSTWLMYDYLIDRQPELRVTLTGMSGLTGLQVMGPNGEILSYNIGGNSTHRFLYMFNSTRAIQGTGYSSAVETWSPSGTINASRRLDENPGGADDYDVEFAKTHSPFMGIEWNVTLPDVFGSQGEILVDQEGGILIANAMDTSSHPFVHWDTAYDIGAITKNSAGQYPSSISHLWTKGFDKIYDVHNRRSENIRDGFYVRFDEAQEKLFCIDARTGAIRWESEPWGNAWGLFTRIYEIAYNTVTTSGFDGHVRNYDGTTGELRWDFYKGSSGFENAYGSYPEYAGLTIADGTVYCTADEHSADGTLWRGAQMWAINIETGELEWQINGMYRQPAVVDGIVIALNSYDGQVYAFGKGPSKTTITAPQTQVTVGEKVMITGSVLDQTPAQKDTAAISDESIGLWMEYLHQQKDFPTGATGVDVMIDVLDSNGNYYNIGTAISTTSGSYAFEFTPEIPGQFQIFATFAGSNSYGSSYAETAMTVVDAPEPTPEPTPTPAPMTDTYIAGSSIAIIAAIAVVAFLLLRKK